MVEATGFRNVNEQDIGTFYATEKAQLPTLKCPNCGSAVTSLYTIVTEQTCQNCNKKIQLMITKPQ